MWMNYMPTFKTSETKTVRHRRLQALNAAQIANLRHSQNFCKRHPIYTRLGYNRHTFSRLPKPIKLGGLNYWIEAEVDDLMEAAVRMSLERIAPITILTLGGRNFCSADTGRRAFAARGISESDIANWQVQRKNAAA